MSIVREEATKAVCGPVDAAWKAKIEKLSQLCEDGVSKTHIAFLGTEILAKSMDRKVDLYAIKPNMRQAMPMRFRPAPFVIRCWCRSRLSLASALVLRDGNRLTTSPTSA
jgi:hypothetical protein